MIRFLRTRNFRTLRLTPRLVTRAKTKIGAAHVLLISQLFRPDEGTWSVMYGDFAYHNFEAYALSSLALLNRPIMSAHLVIHPKWRISHVTKKRTVKPRPKGRHLTLASISNNAKFAYLRSWR